MENSHSGVDKQDGGKLEWNLLPTESLQEVIKVMMYGNTKYEKDNWKKVGNPYSRYWNAAQRHLWAAKDNIEELDESGLPHIAHAAASLLFLLHFIKTKPNDKQFSAHSEVEQAFPSGLHKDVVIQLLSFAEAYSGADKL